MVLDQRGEWRSLGVWSTEVCVRVLSTAVYAIRCQSDMDVSASALKLTVNYSTFIP